jgi:uncharacterized DUF497 family protein
VQEGVETAPVGAPSGRKAHGGPPVVAGVGQASEGWTSAVPLARSSSQGTLRGVRRYRFGELEFSWDERKAVQNARRHGVRFEEAATAFVDPLARMYDDPDHSETEARFLLVGHSLAGRLLLVVHAEKGDTIRIISARRPTPRERDEYEADA